MKPADKSTKNLLAMAEALSEAVGKKGLRRSSHTVAAQPLSTVENSQKQALHSSCVAEEGLDKERQQLIRGCNETPFERVTLIGGKVCKDTGTYKVAQTDVQHHTGD